MDEEPARDSRRMFIVQPPKQAESAPRRAERDRSPSMAVEPAHAPKERLPEADVPARSGTARPDAPAPFAPAEAKPENITIDISEFSGDKGGMITSGGGTNPAASFNSFQNSEIIDVPNTDGASFSIGGMSQTEHPAVIPHAASTEPESAHAPLNNVIPIESAPRSEPAQPQMFDVQAPGTQPIQPKIARQHPAPASPIQPAPAQDAPQIVRQDTQTPQPQLPEIQHQEAPAAQLKISPISAVHPAAAEPQQLPAPAAPIAAETPAPAPDPAPHVIEAAPTQPKPIQAVPAMPSQPASLPQSIEIVAAVPQPEPEPPAPLPQPQEFTPPAEAAKQHAMPPRPDGGGGALRFVKTDSSPKKEIDDGGAVTSEFLKMFPDARADV